MQNWTDSIKSIRFSKYHEFNFRTFDIKTNLSLKHAHKRLNIRIDNMLKSLRQKKKSSLPYKIPFNMF